MKSTISILIFLMTGFFSFSQNYESIFGEESTQWNITVGNLWGVGTNKHTVTGDTTIQDKNYKIIDGFIVEDYMGFLREDTLLGKAWYKNNIDTAEFLIMDLELNVSDSFYLGGNWNPNPGYYKVDSVYFLNDRKHVRFDYKLYFFENKPFTFIEGITSNIGFLYHDINHQDNLEPRLLCSYKNGQQVYGTGPCEILIQGIEENQNKDNIEIFPNPFSDKLNIQILDNKNTTRKYKILNMHGKQIAKGKFRNNKTMNLANLTSGVYLIVVTNENDVIIGKNKVIKE